MIQFYTRTATKLKAYQSLFMALWGLGLVGSLFTAASPERAQQLLLAFVFAPLFCFGWSLLLPCLWFHPDARGAGPAGTTTSTRQLNRMAAIITLFLICGALLGPA